MLRMSLGRSVPLWWKFVGYPTELFVEKRHHKHMQRVNVEQATSKESADQGAIAKRVSIRLAPLPAWLRSRLPSHAPHVFSASELDAIAVSAAFSQPNQDAAGETEYQTALRIPMCGRS